MIMTWAKRTPSRHLALGIHSKRYVMKLWHGLRISTTSNNYFGNGRGSHMQKIVRHNRQGGARKSPSEGPWEHGSLARESEHDLPSSRLSPHFTIVRSRIAHVSKFSILDIMYADLYKSCTAVYAKMCCVHSYFERITSQSSLSRTYFKIAFYNYTLKYYNMILCRY